jgi:solute carrier family 25 oxoglutarate transporter 11
MKNNHHQSPAILTNSKPFLSKFFRSYMIGGLSGCFCVCIMQPVEMIKVQIQAYSEQIGKKSKVSSFGVIKRMLSNGNGFKQFYKGLDAAFIHQMTYTATRMGLYRSMFHSYKLKYDHVPLHVKSGLAFFSGFLGGFIGSPADLIMVRQQLDSTLPLSKQRGYDNALEAFKRIIREEGIFKLWRGSNIVILRSMVLNTCLLGPFDEIKERIMGYYGESYHIRARLIAAAVASFFCTIITLPLDNTKTKIQRMVPDKHGEMPYRGIYHCMKETIRFEGFKRLWVGFGPYFMRLFPHGILILLIQDFIYEMIKK